MALILITDKTFDKVDFTVNRPEQAEYDNCAFSNCNFSGVDLADLKFTECVFTGCNLSLAKLGKTAMREISFRDCKMLGLRFDLCNQFGFSINVENCNLNHSSFFKTSNRKKVFKNSQLQEVDFIECDLSSTIFDNCDLSRATFENTVLEKTDFRTSYNYRIDPEKNRMKKGMYALAGLPGLLEKYDIQID